MMKRYILFTFLLCSCFVNNVVNAQLRDFQMRGLEKVAPIDTLWILSVDTTTGSATKNLGKWRNYEDLLAAYDTDWLRYRTGTVPSNTDTMYHNGIVSIGLTGVLTGALNLYGRIDQRFPNNTVSGTMAIGDGAGNTSMTGAHNILIGQNTADGITSGVQNISLGNATFDDLTDGSYNIAIGSEALNNTTTSNSVAVGYQALKQNTTGTGNLAVGDQSVESNTDGTNNMGIGATALQLNVSGDRNVAVGVAALASMIDANDNTAIGAVALIGDVGSNNTVIGSLAASNATADVINNTIIGKQAGENLGGSGNIFIGYLSGQSETGSDKLYIENTGSTTPLIGGDFAADTVRINGDLSIRDAVSGASTDSVLVWTPTTGRVKMRNAAALGGATNLTIGGSGPSYTVESSTGTDVTITPDIGISLTESPANTLVISNTGAAAAENSSTATTHSFDIIDGTSSSVGSLTLSEGTGITLTTTGTTGAGIVTIASSITDTDDQNLTIEGAGPTYDIAINDGTDVTIQGGGIVTLSESPANTLVITATEVGTMANWLLAASGTGGTETVTTGETVTFAETTGLDATRSTNTVSYALSIDEFTTDATIEEDELLLAYDPSGTNHELIDVNNLPYLDAEVDGSTTNELNTIQEGDVTVQTSNSTIDFGSLFDVTTDGAGEVNVDIDLSEAGIDAGTEGDEYVIIYDPSTATEERVLITSVSGGFDGNGIFDAGNDGGDIGNTTFDVGLSPGGVPGYLNFESGDLYVNASTERVGIGTASPGYGLHVLRSAGAAIESESAGTGGLVFKLEGKADGGGANTDQAGILWNYTDADYLAGAEQGAASMILHKESDAAQWTTLKLQMNEATDAGIVYEKNVDFTNTTESHLAINGGIAFTQNYDASTGGADLSLDRSYYNVTITGGNLTDTIKLPEVAYNTDNWTSSLTSAQCQVGQEYVITNARSAVNLVIGAYNPAGTSDDLIGTRTAPGGSAGSAISIAPGKSVIVKCYQLAGGIGYWNYWLSN